MSAVVELKNIKKVFFTEEMETHVLDPHLLRLALPVDPESEPQKTGESAQAETPGAQQGDLLTLEDIEQETLQKRLAVYNGNASEAAESLGLSRSAFYRRLKRTG